MGTILYHGSPQRSGRTTQQVARAAFSRLLDNLLDQGRFALDQIQRAGPGSTEVRQLLDAGLLRLGARGEISLTPRAVDLSERRMLAELLQPRGGGLPGRHASVRSGPSSEPGDEPRPWRSGESFDHLDLPTTLRQALRRGLPLELRPDDVHVRPGHADRRSACVLLLDLSGSMARHGKFSAARQAALALRGLIRRQFPQDEVLTAGFASRAVRLDGSALLEATPRSVGLFDADLGSVRVAREAGSVPEHFTNIQAGLALARQWLRSRGPVARQVILVTDGEPTAHFEGRELVLAYPPTEATLRATLDEARRLARESTALSVFGIVTEFAPPGLAEFVERLARAGRGVARCCPPRRLGTEMLSRFSPRGTQAEYRP